MTNEMPRHYFLRKSGFLKVFLLAFSFFSFSILQELHARPGDLDGTFGTNGAVITNINFSGSSGIPTSDELKKVMVQRDGKILVLGESCEGVNCYIRRDTYRTVLVRYTSEGRLDSDFGLRGVAYVGHAYNSFISSPPGVFFIAQDFVIQPDDGKILVVGMGASFHAAMIRLNADGSPDRTFGDENSFVYPEGEVINTVALESEGKIIINVVGRGSIFVDGSDRCVYGGYTRTLFRYSTNGVLDTSFNSLASRTCSHLGGGEAKLLIQPVSEKIFLSGCFGGFCGGIAKYNQDGSPDVTFGTRGYMNEIGGYPGLMGLQSDRKIIAANSIPGLTPSGGSPVYDLAIVRFDESGNLDTTFGIRGSIRAIGNFHNSGTSSDPASLLVTPWDKIILSGVQVNDFTVIQYNSNGTLDESFGTHGIVTTDFSGHFDEALSMALSGNCKLIVGGNTTWPSYYSPRDFALAAYESDYCQVADIPIIPTTTPIVQPDPCDNPESLYLDGQDCGARELTVPVTDIPPVPDPAKEYTAPTPDMYEQKTESSWDWNSVWDAFQK